MGGRDRVGVLQADQGTTPCRRRVSRSTFGGNTIRTLLLDGTLEAGFQGKRLLTRSGTGTAQ